MEPVTDRISKGILCEKIQSSSANKRKVITRNGKKKNSIGIDFKTLKKESMMALQAALNDTAAYTPAQREAIKYYMEHWNNIQYLTPFICNLILKHIGILQ